MPIFEYKCDECNNVFEKLISKSNIPNPNCPICNSQKTQKLLSVFSGITKNVIGHPSCTSSRLCDSMGSPCCNHSKCPMG